MSSLKIILSSALLSIALTFILTTPLNAAAQLPTGSLIKSSFAEVFLVTAGGVLRWIPNEETFNSNGYSWSDIIVIPDDELSLYSWGDSLPAIQSKPSLPTVAEIEAKVREYFADIPIMIDVAKCESGFRQFNTDGTILRSSNGLYYGIFQIDKNIHGDYAKSLGMDIETVDGNLAYTRHLYEAKGAQPWPTCSVLASPLKSDLALGDEGAEVKVLQKILNQAGFIVSSSGAGSPGKETDYFGSLTKQAVKQFQCAKNIICTGDEDTTGYGLVGPKTRMALNSL